MRDYYCGFGCVFVLICGFVIVILDYYCFMVVSLLLFLFWLLWLLWLIIIVVAIFVIFVVADFVDCYCSCL